MTNMTCSRPGAKSLEPVIVGNDEAACEFVRERWPRVQDAIAGALVGDRCIVVSDEVVRVEFRRALARKLRFDLPPKCRRRLSEPAPAGAVLLVLFREDEIGVAIARQLVPGGSS